MLSGWRGLRGVWLAAVVSGIAYTVPQFLIATYHGPWLAAPLAGLSCILALVTLLRFWRPKDAFSVGWALPTSADGGRCPPYKDPTPTPPSSVGWALPTSADGGQCPPYKDPTPTPPSTAGRIESKMELVAVEQDPTRKIIHAWLPWAILTVLILIWGVPRFALLMDRCVRSN